MKPTIPGLQQEARRIDIFKRLALDKALNISAIRLAFGF
jgi:hypothetical protein